MAQKKQKKPSKPNNKTAALSKIRSNAATNADAPMDVISASKARTKYARSVFLEAIGSLPKIDIDNPQEIVDRAKLYSQLLVAQDGFPQPPTLATLSLALGKPRSYIKRVLNHAEAVPIEVYDALAMACEQICGYIESGMLDGDVQANAGIYLLHNTAAYTTKDGEDTPVLALDARARSAEEIKAQFANTPDV